MVKDINKMSYSDGFKEYQQEMDNYRQGQTAVTSRNWWIFAISRGRWINCGHAESEAEATEKAFSQVSDTEFKVLSFPTKDISTANRMFKAWLLSNTHNLEQSTSLISRKPAIEAKKRENNELVRDWQ
jgi:hypothetical protein